MKRYKYIIQSPIQPGIDNLWLNNGKLKYFDGVWKDVKSTTNKIEDSSNNSSSTIDIPTIKLGNTPEDKLNNLNVCGLYSTSEVVALRVSGIFNEIQYDTIGNYYNGTISLIIDNVVRVFNIDFNDGTVTIINEYNIINTVTYSYKMGDSVETKEYNKLHLPKDKGIFPGYLIDESGIQSFCIIQKNSDEDGSYSIVQMQINPIFISTLIIEKYEIVNIKQDSSIMGLFNNTDFNLTQVQEALIAIVTNHIQQSNT